MYEIVTLALVVAGGVYGVVWTMKHSATVAALHAKVDAVVASVKAKV
jgi:hypothetical protein